MNNLFDRVFLSTSGAHCITHATWHAQQVVGVFDAGTALHGTDELTGTQLPTETLAVRSLSRTHSATKRASVTLCTRVFLHC